MVMFNWIRKEGKEKNVSYFTADSGTFIERVLLEAVDLQPTAFDVNKVAYEKNAIRRKSRKKHQRKCYPQKIRTVPPENTKQKLYPQKNRGKNPLPDASTKTLIHRHPSYNMWILERTVY